MCYLVYQFGIDVPHWDDHAIRVFVENYFLEESFLKRLKSLFAFHNEHRIATTRIMAIVSTSYVGFLDFHVLQYIGLSGLLFAGIAFFLQFETMATKQSSAAFIGLFLFSTAFHENLLWGMASIQNFWVLPFFLFAVYFAANFQHKAIFGLSFLLALAALFTSGNGILGLPLIGILLLSKGLKKLSFFWFLGTLIFLLMYFWGFENVPSTKIQFTSKTLYAFFQGVGSFLFVHPKLGFLCFIFGIFLVLLAFVIAVSIWQKKHFGFYFTSILFYFGTLGMVALNRLHESPEILLTSKYKLYSICILLTILAYGFSVFKLSRKAHFAVLAASIILYVFTFYQEFFHYPKLKVERMAEALNISRDASSFPIPSRQLEAAVEPSLIDSIALAKEHIYFWEKSNATSNDFVVLKKDSSQYFVAMYPVRNEGFSGIWSYFKEEKEGDLLLYNFPSGIYDLYYAKYKDRKWSQFDTEKIIRVQGVKYIEDAKNW